MATFLVGGCYCSGQVVYWCPCNEGRIDFLLNDIISTDDGLQRCIEPFTRNGGQNCDSWENCKQHFEPVTNYCSFIGLKFPNVMERNITSCRGESSLIRNGCYDTTGKNGNAIVEIADTMLYPIQPDKASNPNPENNATGINLTPTLTWKVDDKATSYKVYFGTSNPPPFVTEITKAVYNPSTLDGNTEYFWRIDEINGCGCCTQDDKITEGDVWHFTTKTLPPSLSPNPSVWEIVPYLEGGKQKMTAEVTTGGTAPIEYYFDCCFGSGTDSGWQSSNHYECNISGNGAWRVRARDANGTMTDWSRTYMIGVGYL